MMLTCRQLADDLASGACEHRGWLHRLKMRFHAFLCPPCRIYAQQMQAISKAARDIAESQEPTAQEIADMRRRCLCKLGVTPPEPRDT